VGVSYILALSQFGIWGFKFLVRNIESLFTEKLILLIVKLSISRVI